MMNRTAKTVAMLSLSACVLVGSAVCSFAAEPTATATVTVVQRIRSWHDSRMRTAP